MMRLKTLFRPFLDHHESMTVGLSIAHNVGIRLCDHTIPDPPTDTHIVTDIIPFVHPSSPYSHRLSHYNSGQVRAKMLMIYG
jgi:hypothetical protein